MNYSARADGRGYGRSLNYENTRVASLRCLQAAIAISDFHTTYRLMAATLRALSFYGRHAPEPQQRRTTCLPIPIRFRLALQI